MILYRLLPPVAALVRRGLEWLWDRYISDPPHPPGWYAEQRHIEDTTRLADEPDPTGCDPTAVTEWIRQYRRRP